MVSCGVVGVKQTPLIGTYLHPSTLEHIPYLEEYLTRFRDQDPILLGDPNINIQDQNPLSQKFTDLLMKFGMVDLLHHLGTMSSPTHENVV